MANQGTKRGRANMQTSSDIVDADAAGPGPSSLGLVALHRSRLFTWKPSAVVCIAPCPGGPQIAVAYENGGLEVWDMHYMVCTQSVNGPALEITSMAWAHDTMDRSWRTFVAYLDGTVAEVLWRQSCVAHATDTHGGVAWSLAAAPVSSLKPGYSHQLAAACDDGSLRLLGVEGGEPGLVMERVLTRLAGRLLTVAWHNGASALVAAGTNGSIHVVDAVAGRELIRITASSSTTRTVTVWRVLSLPDGTLVSGDSDGATQFWEGRFGTLLHRFSQHAADVTALAGTPDGTTVFASGVDAQVAQFVRVPGKTQGSPDVWQYTHYKRPHTHDVRALAAMPANSHTKKTVLVSGGVDAQLIAYPIQSFLQEHPIRISRVPQRPRCSVIGAPAASSSISYGVSGLVSEAACPSARILMAQHETLDIWATGEALLSGLQGSSSGQQSGPSSHSGGGYGFRSQGRGGSQTSQQGSQQQLEGEGLDLASGPRLLARIELKGGRAGCIALAPSGRYAAACTAAGLRVYALRSSSQSTSSVADADNEQVDVAEGILSSAALSAAGIKVQRLPLLAAKAVIDKHGKPSVAVAFTPNDQLLVSHHDGTITLHTLPGGELLTKLGDQISTPPGTHGDGNRASDDQAWRFVTPMASSFCVSPDGKLVAVAGSFGTRILTLPGLQLVGRLLRADGPTTSLAWSPDGKLLALSTGSPALYVWDVATGQPLPWVGEHNKALGALLNKLPGAPTGISFHPDKQLKRLLVSSPGGMVHLDLDQPLSDGLIEALAAKHKRGRARPEPSAHFTRVEARGTNGRLVRTPQPTVWLGFIPAVSSGVGASHVGASADVGQVLLLEKPWEDVLASLPPPLLRHRYGS